MKTFAWLLTAAAILIGADVFIAASDPSAIGATASDRPVTLGGTNGMPTPPID